MPAFAIVLNSLILGKQYFTSIKVFAAATAIGTVAACIEFVLCGQVAVILKDRFPLQQQLFKRLCFMILTFLLLSGLYLFCLFRLYEAISFLNYQLNESVFAWSYFALGILNVFLTFLMEGIATYEEWKKNRAENEKLHHAFKQSRLLGLKSQVNPHFLFNSLNSLSSLIQDDEKKAEKFLDEMSKVYRYMLRTDEEQLVTLDTELKFIDSYMHLLRARYGEGLQLKLIISEEDRNGYLPPLSLQAIIENAFSLNTISKQNPLLISIQSGLSGVINISNNVQPKMITEAMDYEAALDNLVNKYKLLGDANVIIEEDSLQRIIRLPLITKREEVPV
jgi:sensor histidine kinase YesM